MIFSPAIAQGEGTGATLIDALQASPYRDVGIEPKRAPMPARRGFGITVVTRDAAEFERARVPVLNPWKG